MSKAAGGQKGVYVWQEVREARTEQVVSLEQLLKDGGDGVDELGGCAAVKLADALDACQSLFANVKLRTSNKRILLFTNNDTPHPTDAPDDRKKAVTKAGDARDNGVTIDLVQLPASDGSFSVDRFYKDIVSYVADTGSDAPAPLLGPGGLLQRVGSKIANPRTLMKIPFFLDNQLQIGVKFYSGPMEKKRPPHINITRRGNEPTTSKTKYFCSETEAQLRSKEIKRGTMYGGEKVIFDQDETAEMKAFGKPGLHLMGFKPAARLKLHYNVKNAKFVRPDETVIEGSTTMFNALLDRLDAKEQVAICRLVSRHNAAPSFVALKPQKEVLDAKHALKQSAGFHVIFLPFAEDMRKLEYDTEAPKATEAQTAAMRAVVKQLKVPVFEPGARENFTLSRFNKYLEAICFHRDDIEEMVDQCNPDVAAIGARAEEQIKAAVAAVYPADYVPCANKPAAKRKAGSEGGTAAKRAKAEPVDVSTIDVERHVREGTLKKLTVKDLKAVAQSVKLKPKSKKGDLIEQIQGHFAA